MKSLSIVFCIGLLVGTSGCGDSSVRSASGTKMATVGSLPTDANGHTQEQNNIIKKVQLENDANTVWHLYVISPYARQIILKSTVKGKITSSGKRLTPKKIIGTNAAGPGMSFKVEDTVFYTDEMPAEDGTFGDSVEYIYWTDIEGRNHRHYMLDGQIIHTVDKEMTLSELCDGNMK